MSSLLIGTAFQKSATRILFLGSGELCKEMVIEAQRLGVETIAVDSYQNAPAMQVAHRAHIIDMKNAQALRSVIDRKSVV